MYFSLSVMASYAFMESTHIYLGDKWAKRKIIILPSLTIKNCKTYSTYDFLPSHMRLLQQNHQNTTSECPIRQIIGGRGLLLQ